MNLKGASILNKYKKLPKNLENQRKSNLLQVVEDKFEDIEITNQKVDSQKNIEKKTISVLGNNFPFIAFKSNDAAELDSADLETKTNEPIKTKLVEDTAINSKEDTIKKKNVWESITHYKADNKTNKTNQKGQEEENEMSLNGNVGASKEIAVISNTMVVNGNMELETSLIVNGKILGDINCKDTVEVNFGSIIEGNIQAKSVKCSGSELKGNISVIETFEANNQTKVFGNVEAKRVEISGEVNGEVKASESIVLKKSAVVKGDLFCTSISIEAGAQLDGKVVTVNTSN